MHEPGTMLAGRYRIVRTLGSGGMGVVLEAEQLDLERRVAIKVLDPTLAKDPVLVARLRREARAAAAFSHPNVAQVYALHEEDDGTVLVVMELVRGEPLRTVLREAGGHLAPERVVVIGRALLAGLSAAHAAGVVHRDVKPENVMVVKGDRGRETIKLVDFGIARSRLPSERAPLTERGTVVGTPAYMAPEQVRGEEADARADVWAAAVVLYELATGRRPFRGADTMETMRAVLSEEPPLLSDEVGAPEALSAVVARALRKSPDARFANASEMLAALDAPMSAAPATARPGKERGVGAGAGVGVSVGVGAGTSVGTGASVGASASVDASVPTAPFPLVNKSAPWGIILGLGAVVAAIVYALQAPPAAPLADDAASDASLDTTDDTEATDDPDAQRDAAFETADDTGSSIARDPLQTLLADCVHDAHVCFTIARDDAGRLESVMGSGDVATDTCAFRRLADAATPDEVCVE
jgi:serine/threonine-protein kinase